jgi:hypothetical protein
MAIARLQNTGKSTAHQYLHIGSRKVCDRSPTACHDVLNYGDVGVELAHQIYSPILVLGAAM